MLVQSNRTTSCFPSRRWERALCAGGARAQRLCACGYLLGFNRYHLPVGAACGQVGDTTTLQNQRINQLQDSSEPTSTLLLQKERVKKKNFVLWTRIFLSFLHVHFLSVFPQTILTPWSFFCVEKSMHLQSGLNDCYQDTSSVPKD